MIVIDVHNREDLVDSRSFSGLFGMAGNLGLTDQLNHKVDQSIADSISEALVGQGVNASVNVVDTSPQGSSSNSEAGNLLVLAAMAFGVYLLVK